MASGGYKKPEGRVEGAEEPDDVVLCLNVINLARPASVADCTLPSDVDSVIDLIVTFFFACFPNENDRGDGTSATIAGGRVAQTLVIQSRCDAMLQEVLREVISSHSDPFRDFRGFRDTRGLSHSE